MKRTALLAALAATAIAGCDSAGTRSSGTGPAPERRTDVNVKAPGVDVEVQGRKPDSTKRDVNVDIDVKKRDRDNR